MVKGEGTLFPIGDGMVWPLSPDHPVPDGFYAKATGDGEYRLWSYRRTPARGRAVTASTPEGDDVAGLLAELVEG